MELAFAERPSASNASEAAGLLILHHGRGTSEQDLIGLADVLDPERRLHVVAPRGPLQIPGWPGNHWYVVPRVGYPDPDTFWNAHAGLASFHDSTWERTGIGADRTILGGFSMGSVMSYALGLDGGRPAPAGILAFSGFIPIVPNWSASTADRLGLKAFIAHGRSDPIMGIEFAHQARDFLTEHGIEVDYYESEVSHHIDPTHAALASRWIDALIGP